MKSALSLFTLSGILFIVSCTYEKAELPVPNPVISCDTSQVDSIRYSTVIKPMVQTYCATNSSCHITGGAAPGDFSSYADLKDKADAGLITERVFVLKNMPPAGSNQLSDCHKNKLKAWINKGAQNN